MIRSIIVTNHLGESLTLELGAPWKSGLLVTNVDGIGPTKATISTNTLATVDGARYTSSRLDPRNISITLKMLELPTIEHTRHLAYEMFPPKKKVRLAFVTDTRTCYTEGYVESNNPVIFSSMEYTQITVVCPDPYMYASEEPIVVQYSRIDPMFEFPFENCPPAISVSSKLGMDSLGNFVLSSPYDAPSDIPDIEFSSIKDGYYTIIDYPGDFETGCVFHVKTDSGLTGFSIANVNSDERMSFDISKIKGLIDKPFGRFDELVIDTSKGHRSVRLIRDGSSYNAIQAMDRDSDWIRLESGPNMIIFDAGDDSDYLTVDIEYNYIYAGV